MRSSLPYLTIAVAMLWACAPAADLDSNPPGDIPSYAVNVLAPDAGWTGCPRISPGAPVGVSVDFGGAVLVADASPPRLISFTGDGRCQEFQQPVGRPAFRPSDVALRGFFVYAVDETNRTLLRWDSSGGYRDVLLNFEDLPGGRRVSPYGLDVDASGRVAVSDVENHQVLVLDTYLNVDVAFGNYGSFDGQMNGPEGVSFTPRGDLIVADTGNGRLQVFSDAGAHRRTIPARGADNPMRKPRRAVAAADGTLYVADPSARRVFVIPPDGTIRAFVASADSSFEPTDLAFGRDGRLYVTDAASKSLLVFKVM